MPLLPIRWFTLQSGSFEGINAQIEKHHGSTDQLRYTILKKQEKYVFAFYKYKHLLQYGDLEKYIQTISDTKHIIQTKIKKKKSLQYLPIFGL